MQGKSEWASVKSLKTISFSALPREKIITLRKLMVKILLEIEMQRLFKTNDVTAGSFLRME